MGVWTLAFIFLSSVSSLKGSALMKASSNPTLLNVHKRDNPLPFDGWVANRLKGEDKVKKEGKEEKEEKEEKKGRWIELTPVSSPLAATKEQMLTLGLKIVSLPARTKLNGIF